MTGLSSETIHASCVAIGGKAVLIAGRSGAGKSDLALRLIDRGAQLVSDDYTFVRRAGERLLAAAPAKIAGKIEMRGIGILNMEAVADVPVCLLVDLEGTGDRLPSAGEERMIAGVLLPTILLNGLEASAPLKVEAALKRLGFDLK
jgi:serine kinase of HPr protein (carbohydrate metabolism regulator)